MKIKVYIQKNQVHLCDVYDEQGNPTGKQEIQFGIQCKEYPDLPTYGLRIPYPCTKAQVSAAIQAKIQEVKEQLDKDNQLRQQIENMGYNTVNHQGTDYFYTEVEAI